MALGFQPGKHKAMKHFADGGKVPPPKSSFLGLYNSAKSMFTDTPEQAQKKADLAKYKANAAAERNAMKNPPPAVQTSGVSGGLDGMGGNTMKEREKAAGLARGGEIKGPNGAMAQMAQKKSAEGAKLEGPGTSTSDSIPAVVNTGEPIKVATGERIVSKKQDAFLLQQAQAAGFKSIDEWLEAGTGKPVGPTIKYSGDDKLQPQARGFFAGGKPGDEELKRVVSQIPTGGAPGAGPTAQPDTSQSASGSELERNVSNITGALGPLAGGSRLLMAAGKAGSVIGQSPMVARAFDVGTKVAPYAVPLAGAVGLSAASSNDSSSVAPVQPAPAPAPPVAPKPASLGGDATMPGQDPGRPAAAPSLNGSAGREVGGGIFRFDQPGKTPLFTNRTDAAGLADNAALQARASVTAQNQGAMDGIQARQDASDQSALNKMQYDSEVAGAQAINQQQANLGKSLKQRELEATIAQGQQTDATKRYKVDAQSLAARGALGLQKDRMALDGNADKRAETAAGFQNRQQQRVETLHLAYEKADGADKSAIAEQLRILTGSSKPDQWQAIALQGSTDPATGAKTEGVLAAVNKGTGEMRKFDQAGVNAPKTAPKQGEVVQGHRFKGGNPADKNNWEKI